MKKLWVRLTTRAAITLALAGVLVFGLTKIRDLLMWLFGWDELPAAINLFFLVGGVFAASVIMLVIMGGVMNEWIENSESRKDR